jgi:hypothetical protein
MVVQLFQGVDIVVGVVLSIFQLSDAGLDVWVRYSSNDMSLVIFATSMRVRSWSISLVSNLLLDTGLEAFVLRKI